jgi:hypothetical protein
LFYFVGYEGLRENLGRTITSTVPDDNARRGLIPDPAQPGQLLNVGVNAGVAPYVNEYPRANGAPLGDGTALYSFQFDQVLSQDFLQGRVDYNVGPGSRFFGRYTLDDADQQLPLDYPQFPRSFLSTNQFFTGEYSHALGDSTLSTYRFGYSRTRVGQDIQANTSTPLPPFVPGREYIGNIDVGGLNRFGTQSSVDVRFLQQVLSFQYDTATTRGRHLVKVGALAEPDVQPRNVLVRQPAGVPREPGDQLHRPDAPRRLRAKLALLDRRRLRSGRVPGIRSPHRERRASLRVHDDAGRPRGTGLGAREPDRYHSNRGTPV